MLRFLLGLLSGALLADLLRQKGVKSRFHPPPQNLNLTFVEVGGTWHVQEVLAGQASPRSGKPPGVGDRGTVEWRLPSDGPEFVVLQLEPDYFTWQTGSGLSPDGIVILARGPASGGAQQFTKLKVKRPTIFFSFDYTYSALCLREAGAVSQMTNALKNGDAQELLENLDLTLAVGESPPRMIIM